MKNRRGYLLILIIFTVLIFFEVATANSFTASQFDVSGLTDGWIRIVSGGFDDTNNVGINNFVDFIGYRYVSVYNSKTGAEIWRTLDGDRWEKIASDGLGNPDNTVIILFIYKGKLYAGTYNKEDGAEIWVSSDGLHFKQIVSGGLGDKDNIGIGIPIILHNKKLLVPVQNGAVGAIKDGAEIWISEDGEHFNRSVKNGLGDRSNIFIYFLSNPFEQHKYVGFEATLFKEYAYLGTYNPNNGGEIWRSKDGINWEKMIENGFGDSGNTVIRPDLVFRDNIYVVTLNLNGLNVFRSKDGETWERVVEDGFHAGGYKNIFGVLNEINGKLYLSTFSTPTVGAFEIWRSNDGKNWTQVGLPGFGNKNNHGAGISQLSDGQLYLSTINTVDGIEVWKSRDGSRWEMIFKEDIGSETHVGGGVIEFNNHLYLYIYDSKNGLEIWKYTNPLHPVTAIQTSTMTAQTETVPTTSTTLTIQTITTGELTVVESTTIISTQTTTTSGASWGTVEYLIIGISTAIAVAIIFVILKITVWTRPLPPPPPPE